MEFERRKLEYDSLVSQNTIFMPTCKVCLAVELLKHIMCPNNCQIDIQPEKQMIFDKIISDLQPFSPEEIFVKQVQQQFEIHQEALKFESEIYLIKNNFNEFKQNIQTILREEIQNATKKMQEQVQTLDLLKDLKQEQDKLAREVAQVQQKLSEQTDKLARMSMKNEANLRMKNVEESQSKMNKINESLLQQMINKQEEIQQKQDIFFDQIAELQNQQQELKKQYQEVKKVSLHSSNLVTAADSVFSAHQEMKNFEKRTSYTLEELKTEIENLKKTVVQANQFPQEKQTQNFMTQDIEIIMDQYQNELKGLQNQMRELKGQKDRNILYHPGNFQYDEKLNQICWSCCHTNRECKGCTSK